VLKISGRYERDIGIRVISGASSGLLIILLGRSLTGADFAHLQIYFNFGGIIGWIFDFGLLGLCFVNAAKNNRPEFASSWRLRLILLIIPTLSISLLTISGQIGLISTLLILVGLQESIIDAHLPIRQILQPPLSNTLSVVLRKVVQLSILVFFILQKSELTVSECLFAIGIPSAVTLVFDFYFFTKIKGRIDLGNLKNSAKFFIQNVGTGMATLDLFLLGHFGFQSIIYPYTLGKKFYSFLMIPGATFIQRMIKVESEVGTNLGIFWTNIRRICAITSISAAACGVALLAFSNRFFGENRSYRDVFLTMLLIFLPIISSVSTNLNAILVSRYLFKRAAIATFLSTAFYLTFLTLGFSLGFNGYLVFVISLILNPVIEIILELDLLFQIRTMIFFKLIESKKMRKKEFK